MSIQFEQLVRDQGKGEGPLGGSLEVTVPRNGEVCRWLGRGERGSRRR